MQTELGDGNHLSTPHSERYDENDLYEAIPLNNTVHGAESLFDNALKSMYSQDQLTVDAVHDLS